MEVSAHAQDEIYTPGYYDRIGALEHTHWWHLGAQRAAKALLASVQAPTFSRVLDAGCGTGGMMAWAEAELGAGALFGVDLSPDAVRACSARNPQWSVQQGSVMDMPLPDGGFDLVICNDVIQHLPTDGGDLIALKEIRRVLKPGGLLVLRTNSRQGVQRDPNDHDYDYKRYVRQEVVDLLEQGGFAVRRATYVNVVGGVHETVRRWLRPPHAHHHHQHDHEAPAVEGGAPTRHVYEGLTMRDTAAERPGLNRILLGLFSVEAAILGRGGSSLPFGHSIVAVAEAPRT
ncbi:MAG: class I SAM-dependent methyltransferase [Brevundimonas sp.]